MHRKALFRRRVERLQDLAELAFHAVPRGHQRRNKVRIQGEAPIVGANPRFHGRRQITLLIDMAPLQNRRVRKLANGRPQRQLHGFAQRQGVRKQSGPREQIRGLAGRHAHDRSQRVVVRCMHPRKLHVRAFQRSSLHESLQRHDPGIGTFRLQPRGAHGRAGRGSLPIAMPTLPCRRRNGATEGLARIALQG
eukprot:scaffold237_cov233-Pinguiococcus_pyrenoidosus.AAC.8